jgi:hypothetical protein
MGKCLKIALLITLALIIWGCGDDEKTTGPNGNGLTISLSLVGSLSLPYPGDVVVVGDTAYIADDSLIVAVVDISDKTHPQMLGHENATGDETAVGLAIKDNYAYAALESDGVYIVDITEADSPFVAHKFYGPYAKDVAVAGNYAFIADQDFGLRIVDITDPASPSLIGNYPSDGPFGVAVSGNYVYCADNDSGIFIADVSDPALPSEVGRYRDLYSPRQIEVQNQMAYVQTDTAFVIFDVSNAAQPTPIGSYAMGCLDIAVEGNVAYISARNQNSLVALDISDPTQIRLLDSITTPIKSLGLDAEGNYIYSVGDDQFLIYRSK